MRCTENCAASRTLLTLTKLSKNFLVAVGELTTLDVIDISLTLYASFCLMDDDMSYAKTQNTFCVKYAQGQGQGVPKDL